MTDRSSSQLTFQRVTSGAQLFLNNGTVWRLGLKDAERPSRWTPGDPVSITEDGGHDYAHLITNLANGDAVRVIRSREI
jgi:hypothetical protein